MPRNSDSDGFAAKNKETLSAYNEVQEQELAMLIDRYEGESHEVNKDFFKTLYTCQLDELDLFKDHSLSLNDILNAVNKSEEKINVLINRTRNVARLKTMMQRYKHSVEVLIMLQSLHFFQETLIHVEHQIDHLKKQRSYANVKIIEEVLKKVVFLTSFREQYDKIKLLNDYQIRLDHAHADLGQILINFRDFVLSLKKNVNSFELLKSMFELYENDEYKRILQIFQYEVVHREVLKNFVDYCDKFQNVKKITSHEMSSIVKELKIFCDFYLRLSELTDFHNYCIKQPLLDLAETVLKFAASSHFEELLKIDYIKTIQDEVKLVYYRFFNERCIKKLERVINSDNWKRLDRNFKSVAFIENKMKKMSTSAEDQIFTNSIKKNMMQLFVNSVDNVMYDKVNFNNLPLYIKENFKIFELARVTTKFANFKPIDKSIFQANILRLLKTFDKKINLKFNKVDKERETIQKNVFEKSRKMVFFLVYDKIAPQTNIVEEIQKCKFDIKEIESIQNNYVGHASNVIKNALVFVNYIRLTKYINKDDDFVSQCIASIVGESMVEGFAAIKKCTNEGRSLMQLDLQSTLLMLDSIVPDIKKHFPLDKVNLIIKLFYYPEDMFEDAIKAAAEVQNIKFTELQVDALTKLFYGGNAVMTMQRIRTLLKKSPTL